MRVFLIILLFLLVSALVIVSNNNLHLRSGAEAKEFASLYYSWLIHTGANFIKATGYIIGFQWLPGQNGDISTNSTQ